MRYIYLPSFKPGDTFYQGVYEILRVTETEFVPPLHARCSTTQKDLSKTLFSEDEKERNLRAYFGSMLSQQFIIAAEGDEVIGFLSFRNGEKEKYISTIAVATKARKQGVAQGLYEALFDAIGDKETYSTRTWESNEYHQRILNKLGFRLKERKDEGRTDINGKPVPSLYYIKVD